MDDFAAALKKLRTLPGITQEEIDQIKKNILLLGKDTDQHLFTVQEVSEKLRISSRTLWRYIEAGMIEYCVLNPGSQRRQVRFTEEHIASFIKKNSRGLQTAERPKRAYHTTKKKYARKKVRRGKAA